VKRKGGRKRGGERVVECSFFIPIRRDANLSDGLPHASKAWEQLDKAVYDRFEGMTAAPGYHRGFYRDPDTGQRVDDESRQFIVAVPESRLDELRQVLAEACGWFFQKCIYLSVAGQVEFVKTP
jgi:hypothetical protein